MLMRKLKLFILLFASLFYVQNVQALTFTLPLSLNNQDINQYLAKKVNVKQSFGFPGIFTFDYQVKDLNAQLGKSENQIEMDANILGAFHIGDEELTTQLKVTFTSTPYYDPKTGAIYLKDFKIIHSDIAPKKYMKQLSSIMPLLNDSLEEILSDVPIFKLNDEKYLDVVVKKFAKGIVIAPNKLSFEIEL